MSGPNWRFTDDQGVERSIGTAELRAALASGKVAPSTMVWHEGMKEWAPAFTLPELSGAAIAAARSSRASIPPADAKRDGPADSRPRSVPPPLPKRVPSVAPPLPVRRPGRGTLRTLTGIEPPELLASLGITVGGAGSGPSADSAIHNEPTRDTHDGEGDFEDDATDVMRAADLIPRAPKVPKEANSIPRTVRRIPSIPPPPLPAHPTPPPEGGPPPEVPHRPTLMGLANRRPSRPPPRRSAAPPRDTSQEATVVGPQPAAESGRSKPPPPPRRKPEALPQPKRLNRTLEMDAVPESRALKAPVAKAEAQTAVGPAPTREDPKVEAQATVGSASVLRAPARPAAASTPASPAAATTLASSTGAAEAPAAASGSTPTPSPVAAPVSVAPRPEPASPQGGKIPRPKDSVTGTITTVRKSAEGTLIMELPAKTKAAAETTDLMATRPADADKLLGDASGAAPPGEKPPRAKTMEMALEDHVTAASQHPEPPESVARTHSVKPKAEDTNTTFQVDGGRGAQATPSDPDDLLEGRPRRRKPALEVPLSSLIAASLVWIVGLLGFFFAGRISGKGPEIPVARDGLAEAFLLKGPQMDLQGVAAADPKPCSVARQPKRWAQSASKSVPFEFRPEGEAMLLGYAQGDREGVGLKIDPKSGKFEEAFRKKTEADLLRVAPTGTTDGFFLGEKGERVWVPASAQSPRFVVLEKSGIGAADAPTDQPTSLWALEGDGEITAESTLRVSESQFLLTFRRGGEVWGGFFGADKLPKGKLARVAGSGGKVGRPKSATNGSDVAVVFADKPNDQEGTHWGIRIGRAAVGTVPETTEEVDLPEGGPGGDAIAPDIVGFKDGRWLLMWTEGSSGERSILAQTYDRQFAPLGDPIALSPPAGSFGQAALAVVGTYTTVAFLQAADEGFELWGAVLQCGQ